MGGFLFWGGFVVGGGFQKKEWKDRQPRFPKQSVLGDEAG